MISVRKTVRQFIFFALLLSNCTTTTTRTKNPVFIDMGRIERELTSLVKAQNINLAGMEITTNKTTKSELEVSITNGEHIPTGKDERRVLGKMIAVAIKSNLKDKNEFESYKVLFVTKVEDAGVTRRSWVGNVFSSSEL